MPQATAVKPGLVEIDPKPPTKYGPASSEVRWIEGRPIERRRFRCELSGDDAYRWVELPAAQEKFVPGPQHGDAAKNKQIEAQVALRLLNWSTTPTLFASSRSGAQKFREVEQTAVHRGTLDLRPADPYREEVAQLIADKKPGQAAVLRLQFPEPPIEVDPEALFNPGLVIGVSTVLMRLVQLGTDELTAMVQKHRRGDGGIYGSIVGVTLTDDQKFCPPYFAPQYRSAAAVASGSGLVLSRFSIFRPALDQTRHGDSPLHSVHAAVQRMEGEWAEVVTILSPTRPPKTLVYSSRDSCRIL
jgi:hypothetical protein